MKRKYLFILITGFNVLFSGCEKYLDVNTDPATPQVGESKSLTPPLFAAMERGIQFDSRYLGPLIQNWGYYTSGYWADLHGWTAGSDVTGEIWRQNYYALGNNLTMIMDDATKTEQYNFLGMAQAIRAWSWQVTTDYHGDIILKQAFDNSRFTFDYDPQEDVYAEVVRLCNEAVANLTRTDGKGLESAMAAADLVYKGKADRWIKFCYGILARNAGNLSNKSTYNADKVIEYVDKSLASNSDNFLVPNTGTNTDNASFYGPWRSNMTYLRQSALIVNLLNGGLFTGVVDSVIDPRRATMITASPNGTYNGVIVGSGDPNRANTTTNAIPNPWGAIAITNPGAGNGKYLFRDNSVFPIMTYSEMQFIKAEAAWRKGDLSTAYDAYKNGISSSIDFVSSQGTTITTAQKNAYLASASVVQTSSLLTLRDIMLQKYIALWGFGFVETWSDLRRFHYTAGDKFGNNPYLNAYVLPTTLYSDNGGKPAYRYRPRYNSEYLWNIEALKKIGADQPDYHTYEVWFSKPD
ncbi:SusD/RagB family nutrient-binding outer membrane lipoprotein [Arcticibacter tournemirensis]